VGGKVTFMFFHEMPIKISNKQKLNTNKISPNIIGLIIKTKDKTSFPSKNKLYKQ